MLCGGTYIVHYVKFPIRTEPALNDDTKLITKQNSTCNGTYTNPLQNKDKAPGSFNFKITSVLTMRMVQLAKKGYTFLIMNYTPKI